MLFCVLYVFLGNCISSFLVSIYMRAKITKCFSLSLSLSYLVKLFMLLSSFVMTEGVADASQGASTLYELIS